MNYQKTLSEPDAGGEASPDFAGIAERLDRVDRVSLEGWWGNWWGCMYAETIIRDFGPLVASAAAACNAGDEGSSTASTTSMIRSVDSYLQWEAECPSSEDDETKQLIQKVRCALAALESHLSTSAKIN